MRVVVTGATGNLGTALLRRLREEGDVEVTGVVRRPPQDEGGVRWVAADLGTPASVPLLERATEGADAVVHLAWLLQPGHDAALLEAVNVDGTRRVATAALAAGAHLVHASSVGAYAPRAVPVPDVTPVGPGRTGAAAGGDPADPADPHLTEPRDAVGEDWPTTGVPSSQYSRQKVAAERLLDELVRERPDARVARLRPGLVLQAAAGAEIGRYFLGGLVPLGLVRRVTLPAFPLPAEAVFQVVHADDVADAVVRVLRTGATGPFNLVTAPALTPLDVAQALRVQRVATVPAAAVRALAAATWRARLQPTEPGWVDLLTQVPLLSSALARDELGWRPRVRAASALVELLDAMSDGRGASTPPLVPRRGLRRRRSPGADAT